jgi:hypothetical protein
MLFGSIASVLTEERVTEKPTVDDRPSLGILSCGVSFIIVQRAARSTKRPLPTSRPCQSYEN